MTERRFPPPWIVEQIPGGLKVIDAEGQSLAYVYSRKIGCSPCTLAAQVSGYGAENRV
jgi:hypothetical protein